MHLFYILWKEKVTFYGNEKEPYKHEDNGDVKNICLVRILVMRVEWPGWTRASLDKFSSKSKFFY